MIINVEDYLGIFARMQNKKEKYKSDERRQNEKKETEPTNIGRFI